MWLWKKVIKPILEWASHAETIHTIAQAEFFRTLFWPVVLAMSAAVTGYLEAVPVMWIIMVSTLTFMGAAQGMLRTSEYLERKNPLNKFNYIGTHFGCDLSPAAMPVSIPAGNRHQRRAQGVEPQQQPQILTPNALNPFVMRNIDYGQVSLEFKNNASFPISFILHNAMTEVAGITPPRSVFPKSAVVVQPGALIRIVDDRMTMNGLACGRLIGKIDWIIKYGLPGKERFELHLVAHLDIMMEGFGLVTAVASRWAS